MSRVIPIDQRKRGPSPRGPIEHDPMDDPATRVDHYIAEAKRMLEAAEEALLEVSDPIERSYARTSLLKLSLAATEAVVQKDTQRRV